MEPLYQTIYLTAPQVTALGELSARWALGTRHLAALVIRSGAAGDALRVDCPGAAPLYVHPDGTISSVY